MKRWLSGIAVVVFVLVAARAACAQEELSVTIVSRGDDAFKELIAQFEKKTGRKVAVRFPNFIESRDTISEESRSMWGSWNFRMTPM